MAEMTKKETGGLVATAEQTRDNPPVHAAI